MPTLNIQRKTKEIKKNEHTASRELRRKAYNSQEWRKLRNEYIKNNPLCAECLRQGKVTPAVDVHHHKSPFKTGEINWTLLLDYNNLESLCKKCHAEHHNKEQGHRTVQDILRQLADLLDNNDKESEEVDSEHK